MIVLSFYPGGEGNRSLVFYVPAALELVLFVVTLFIKGLRRVSLAAIQTFLIIFLAIVIAFSLASLVYSQSPYTTRFLLYFFVFELLLIFDAVQSLIGNFVVITGFYLSFKFFPTDTFGGVFRNWNFDFINVIMAAIFSIVLNWFASYMHIKNWILAQSLTAERNRYRDESIHDTLTGLNNRRSFDQSVEFYISVCSHVHQTVCVVMLDVDYFKLYNDFYGHPKGDIVLQSMGDVLKRLVDEEHVYAARVGGEEFIMLWTENRTIECERIGLKLRQMIIDLNIPHEKSKAAPYITASVGMYIMRGGTKSSPEELYRAADTALYKAKEWGRNRIVLYDSNDGNFREVDLRNYKELRRE
ncbi:MAG: GGDEF domain-containing protein [Spirochaetaceae bacterium]|jgi:diguanylate cyclase (GGDEF)-like protein|nr:GGDEF domain-containing protein [Spirochaetaceae bacterium]